MMPLNIEKYTQKGVYQVCILSCSIMSNSLIPWTAAGQALLSMEFSRQEYWSGLPFPTLTLGIRFQKRSNSSRNSQRSYLGCVCVCVCVGVCVCVFSFFNTDHQHFQIRNISQEKEIFSLDFTFFFIRISVFFPMSGSSRPGTLYSQNLFQVKGIFNSVFSHLNNDICLLVPLTLDCKLYKINI